MSGSEPAGRIHTTRHTVTVQAEPAAVYGLIADVDRWPCVFSPTVHVERLTPAGPEERLRLWAFANGEVRSWTSRRSLEPDRHRIRFWQEKSPAPVQAMGGAWRLSRLPSGGTRVVLLHYFRTEGDDRDGTEWIRRAVDHNSEAELAALKRVAELGTAFEDLVVSFSDSVVVDAPAEPVYAFLHRADRWPGLLPHVARVTLQEPAPDVQFVDMDTRGTGGSVHTTRSVRLCFPHHGIVYKQTGLPDLLAAHVGRWTLRAVAAGVEATAHHTVIVRPEAIGPSLGEGTGLAEARNVIRRTLGANSLATLHHAQRAAEAAVGRGTA